MYVLVGTIEKKLNKPLIMGNQALMFACPPRIGLSSQSAACAGMLLQQPPSDRFLPVNLATVPLPYGFIQLAVPRINVSALGTLLSCDVMVMRNASIVANEAGFRDGRTTLPSIKDQFKRSSREPGRQLMLVTLPNPLFILLRDHDEAVGNSGCYLQA